MIARANRAVLHTAMLAAVAVGFSATSVLATTGTANAAVWEDVTCSLNGHVASTEGWTSRMLGTQSAGASATNTCSTPGGALIASDESRGELQSSGSGAEWAYTAPKGEPIAGGTITATLHGAYGEAWLSMPEVVKGEGVSLLDCLFSASCSQADELPLTKHGADHVWAGAVCVPLGAEHECRQTDGINAEVSVSSATVLLSDNSRPTATEVSGSILGGAASGTASLSFVAGDSEGPGVYGVVVRLDGDPVHDGTPDTNGGKCVTVGTAAEGSRQFEATQPCPQSVPVSVQVPTGGLGNGQHTLTIEAEDAAGVNAVVYSAPITIANVTPPNASASSLAAPTLTPRGAANGSPASDIATIAAHWVGTKAALSTTGAYGHARTINGRLTDPAGAPIVGAIIEVSQRPSALGASASAMTSARTASDGSFSVRVPAGESTTLQLAYRSHAGDPTPAASINLTLAVPASIHLTVNQRVASVGQAIRLAGKLTGTLGVRGKHLIVEARGPGEPWLEFHGAKAGSAGRFSVSHKFKFPGPVRYQFRVVCEPEPAFPFARGVSNTVSVWER